MRVTRVDLRHGNRTNATRPLCSLGGVETLFDLTTCLVSIADIAFDIAVAIEFYQSGQYAYFWLSVGIFLLAQARGLPAVSPWCLDLSRVSRQRSPRAL